jgi:hypothetical protein
MSFWSEFPLLDECHFWQLGRPQKDVAMSNSWIDADAAGLTGWELQMDGVTVLAEHVSWQSTVQY